MVNPELEMKNKIVEKREKMKSRNFYKNFSSALSQGA
jgi:hypothetical protein